MNIVIKNMWIGNVTDNILSELKLLFHKAYVNSEMYNSFLNDLDWFHEYFQIFLAYDRDKIIWIALLEDKKKLGMNYLWYAPVYLKRFTVDPEYRSLSIWKKLLNQVKDYALNVYKIPVFFWWTNELWAAAFYLREWAYFHLPSIEAYSDRNLPSENIEFFKEFVTNKKFRTYRYPLGKGIPFVYILDKTAQDIFTKNGFQPETKIFDT